MSIVLADIEYVACAWFGHAPGMDFLAVLYRLKAGGVWELKYRFRHHRDPDPKSRRDPFDGKDEKSWWLMPLPANKDPGEVERLFSTLVDVPNLRKVEVRGDVKAFLDVLSREPSAHFRYGTPAGQ